MTSLKSKFILAVIASGAVCACQSRSGSRGGSGEDLVIKNVSVIGMVGENVDVGQTVVVHGGVITQIGQDPEVPSGAIVVDGTGKFLMPALADMHVHLQNEQDLTVLAALGVTLVRNMHADSPDILKWKAQSAQGAIFAPEIVAAGPLFDGPYQSHPGAVTEKPGVDPRSAVLEQKQQGYDFIKLAVPHGLLEALERHEDLLERCLSRGHRCAVCLRERADVSEARGEGERGRSVGVSDAHSAGFVCRRSAAHVVCRSIELEIFSAGDDDGLAKDGERQSVQVAAQKRSREVLSSATYARARIAQSGRAAAPRYGLGQRRDSRGIFGRRRAAKFHGGGPDAVRGACDGHAKPGGIGFKVYSLKCSGTFADRSYNRVNGRKALGP